MRGAAIHCPPSVRKGTSIAEHISGSSSFKLGREPEEEALKASELNVDFEGKSSSDTGRNLRQGSECPGRVLGLALGLRWRAGAKNTAAKQRTDLLALHGLPARVAGPAIRAY